MKKLTDLSIDDRNVGLALGEVCDKGRPYLLLPSELRNMRVEGDLGSGKSSFLNSLAYQAMGKGWDTYFADAEQNVFPANVWGDVAQNFSELISLMEFMTNGLLEHRRKLFAEAVAAGASEPKKLIVRDLPSYNHVATLFDMEKLSPFILFWNSELPQRGNVQQMMVALLRQARKYGGVVIISDQQAYPQAYQDAVSQLYRLLPLSVCFRASTKTGRIMLSEHGKDVDELDPGMAFVQMDGGEVAKMEMYLITSEEKITPSIWDGRLARN